jgi:hypothetical protein
MKNYGIDKQKRGFSADREHERLQNGARRQARHLFDILIADGELHLAALIEGAFLDGEEDPCDQQLDEIVLPPRKNCPCPSHHPSCDCEGAGGDR